MRCRYQPLRTSLGCPHSLRPGFGEHAGSSPLLLPPVSVRRTELSRPNLVSPASRSQVALRVTELFLWWTRRVGVPQDPSTKPTLPGGRGGRGGRRLGCGRCMQEQNPTKAPGLWTAGAAPAPLPGACLDPDCAAKERCLVTRDGPRVAAAPGWGQPACRRVHPSVCPSIRHRAGTG